MLAHYLRFAIRSLKHQRTYVAVTVIGLALAFGASLLMLAFVNHELNFETCHERADQIYRVDGTWTNGDAVNYLTNIMSPLGPVLKNNLPEVSDQVRLHQFKNMVAGIDDELSVEEPSFLMADPEVFDVFSIALLQGDPDRVLSEPFSVVISEKMGRDLFAGKEPVGRTITIRDSVQLTVTGVMADMPLNTQLSTNFLASYSTLEKLGIDLSSWKNMRAFNAYTYVLLADGANPASVTEKIPSILAGHLGEEASKCDLKLQPLRDLYLSSHFSDELGPTGSQTDVYLFGGVGTLLMLMACFNYVNLSTARMFHRHREVLVRSVAGASRKQLLMQFLTESVLLVMLAMVLGMAIYEGSLPYLEAYLGKKLGIDLLNDSFVWMVAPALVFMVGILSGGYPAILLARLRMKGILKNKVLSGSGRSKFRRTLVVLQAAIAIGLVGITVGIQEQLNYTRTIDHGFKPGNVRLIEFGRDATDVQKIRFKQELGANGFSQTTLAEIVPGESAIRITVGNLSTEDQSATKVFSTFIGDDDYCSTLGMKLKAGSWLSDESIAGVTGPVLINETAAEALGLEYPIGAQLSSSRGQLTIVGVVEDFHALSLHAKIMNGIITRSESPDRILAINLPAGEQAGMMADISQTWAAVFPDVPFESSPLTSVMADFYSEEQKLMLLFSVSSGLAIFIACLGLLGLASFTVERRTREIGIRKSIGATATSIVKLLLGEFVILITVAGVMAWPFASYALNRWLESFEYGIEYRWMTFALAGVVVLFISLSSVGIQVLRAARSNPVDVLRYE